MKLKSLGKVFELDPENNFVYEKNKKLSRILVDFINIVLDCFAQNYNIDAHSIYLRGSCLDRDVVDKDTVDIDLIIVHEDKSVQSTIWLDKKFHPEIMKKMEELHGFSVLPDIDIEYKEIFLSRMDIRFYSMKIWGRDDLSTSTISRDVIIDHLDKLYDDKVKYCISKVKQAKKDLYLMTVRVSIKVFYRTFGFKVLVDGGVLTRSVYHCHNALMEKYPGYSEELNNILDLFLNVESYSKQQIIDVLDQMQAVIKCLYYGKPSPYILKVCYK